MFVTKENRLEVYNQLYKEGVVIARKNFQAPRHPNIPNVTNLEVIQLMKGFTSKGLVRETFAWRHYYWFLTNEGINYLREYLNIPSNYVPATLKQDKKTQKPFQRSTGPRREFRDREPRERREYRTEESKTVPQVDVQGEQAERGTGATRGRGFARGRGGARGGRGAPRQE